MSFFFGDGFDLYALPADAVNGYWDSGTTSVINLASGRFSGSRGINNQGGNGLALVKSSGNNDAVHHLVVAINITGTLTGTGNCFYFELGDGATVQCTVTFQSGGNIVLQTGALGATLATYTGAITANNTWNAFEIEVVINNTTGSFAVRKNGNTVNDFSATALNTRGGTTNNYASRLTIGNTSTTATTIDDLLWRSDPVSVAWVGDIRCYTRMPATDAAAAWVRPSTFQMQPYFGATTPQNLIANGARYSPFVSQGGAIGAVVVNLLAGYTGNMKCAIYASSSGAPGSALQSATAAINNPVLGANTFTFSPAVSIAKGTQFFVAICPDTGATNATSVGNTAPYSTSGLSGTTTYASFPVANPTGLSAVQAQPFFPVVTPTYNADAVADVYEDSAASYVSSSNVGDSDLYTLTNISGTPATVVGVTTRGYCQKSDAGTRNVAVQLKSGSTTVQSASTALNTTWGWIYRTDLTDPATSAAWTATGVNNVQIGAQTTA